MNKRFQTRDMALTPIPAYDPPSIRALRERYQISQVSLAAMLNISLSTIKQWETGQKAPGGSSAKLLSLLDRKGLDALV